LCETGRIFVEQNGQVIECASVAFILAEPVGERAWRPREATDFYTAKHHATALAAAAGVRIEEEPAGSAAGAFVGWQEGQSAAVGDLTRGWTARFGLLNLALLKALGIEGKVYGGIFAILPANLPATLTARRFADFSLFPAALRDLALVVPEAIPAAEVQRALRQTARAQVGSAFGVEAVTVFDVYRGAGLPPGTKSLAFSLVFRSPTRTLTDDEVNAVFQKVQDDLVKTTGWQIRK
jgi:phenylalanyl-tRNA synthetase beta chain